MSVPVVCYVCRRQSQRVQSPSLGLRSVVFLTVSASGFWEMAGGLFQLGVEQVLLLYH